MSPTRGAPARSRGVGAVPAAVAVAVLALDLWTACSTVYFGDGGELIAAAQSLGVAHPPGYPLYTLLGWLALHAPWGEAAWRMNALSGLFAALTCGTVAWILRSWSVSPVAAAAAGLALAVAREFWAVSTVAEVYTLDLLLIVLVLALASSHRNAASPAARERLLVGCGVVLGLGLAHRPTVLLALPAALLLGWGGGAGRSRTARRTVAWALALLAAVGIPALLYGTLLLRATADPAVNWGKTDDLGALWSHVSTRGFRLYRLGPAGWLRGAAWARVGDVVAAGTAHVGLPLAGLGLLGAVRGRSARELRRATALVALALATLLFGLSYSTEDVEVLFLPLLPVTALAAGLGLDTAGRVAGATGRSALALALVAAPLLLHGSRANLREVTAAADYGRDMLAAVAPRGVLFVEGDDAFVLAYLQQVLGERRDVRIYDRNGVLFRDLLAEHGGVPARRGEPRADYRIRRELETITRELELAGGRPVLFMSWPGYELPAGLRFEPYGLLYRVLRAADPPLVDRPLWSSYAAERVERQARRSGNHFALTVAASYPLMRGERLRFEGDLPGALLEYERASRLAGPSETVHNYLGTIFGRIGELRRAEQEFLAAIEVQPVSVRAWNNLGKARWLQGDAAGAREAWQHSLSIEPAQAEVRARLREAR